MLKLFRTSNLKPRQFEYKPRYYDPEKEALERKMKARANDNSAEMTKLRLRREFGSYRAGTTTKHSSSFVSSSSFRLLLIVCFLLIASYFVLESLLPQFLAYLYPENQGIEMLEEYDYN